MQQGESREKRGGDERRGIEVEGKVNSDVEHLGKHQDEIQHDQ